MAFEDFISNTAREWLKEKGLEVADEIKAEYILWTVSPYNRALEALGEIAGQTRDERLKRLILNKLREEKEAEERFKKSSPDSVYIVSEQFPGDRNPTRQGIYATYALAEQMAAKLTHEYEIEKVHLASSPEDDIYREFDEFADDELGNAHFSADKTLEYLIDHERPEREDGGDGEEEPQFLISGEDDRLPKLFMEANPFERGDIVSWVGREDFVGVVMTSQKRWKGFLQEWFDGKHRDWGVEKDLTNHGLLVNQITKDGQVYHDHAIPFELERIEMERESDYGKLVNAISQAAGEDDMEWMFMCYDELAKDRGWR